MPIVPTHKEASVTLPRVPISKGAQVPEIIGAGVTQTAQILSVVAERMQQARQFTELSNAEIDIMQKNAEFFSGLEARDDFETFEAENKKFFEQLHGEYQKSTTDTQVWRRLDPYIKRTEVQSEIKVRSLCRKKLIYLGRTDYFNNEITLRKLLNEADENETKDIINTFEIHTAGAQAAGYIKAEEAKRLLENFIAGAEEIKAQRERKIIWDGALDRLRTLGFEEAVKFINESNLPSADKNSMGAALQREETQRLAGEKEEDEKITEGWQNEALVKLHEGKLTFQNIMLSPLTTVRKEHWIGLVDKQKTAKLEAKEDTIDKSDPEFYMTMLKQAYAGEIGLNVPISYIGKGLSAKDAEHIRSVVQKRKDKADEHEADLMDLAVSSGSKMIIKGNLFSGFDAGEIRDAYLFEHALREELEAEKDRTKRLNMLTPGTKDYVVDKVLAPYLKDPITRLRETADKIRGKAKPEKIEGEIPKRKKKETIEEYLKRTGQR